MSNFKVETTDENKEAQTPEVHTRSSLNPRCKKWASFLPQGFSSLATFVVTVLFCYIFLYGNNVDMGVDLHCHVEKPNNAMTINLHINESQELDPCDNFFQFACQKWIKENPIPDGEKDWGILSDLVDKKRKIVIEMMEKEAETGDITAFKEAQKFYMSCLEFKDDSPAKQFTLVDFVWMKLTNRNEVKLEESRKVCAKYVEVFFKIAIRQKYLRMMNKTIHLDQVLSETKEIAANVRNQISKLLSTSVDNTVEGSFKPETFENIGTCLGYPDWLFNNTRVQQEYSEFTLKQGTFSDQFFYALDWAFDRKMEMAIRKVEANATGLDTECYWHAVLSGGYAHFEPGLEQIYSHMWKILSWYKSNNPATNYGSIGSILGHEYSHALYHLGFKTNNNGSLTFVEKCLKNHYDRFGVNGLWDFSLDGKRTLQENYSDVAGLKAAYLAFKNSSSVSETAEFLGLKEKYTADQRFFLGYSQMWCESYTLEGIRSKMEAGVHSPNVFRVLGTLQNTKEFAEAWNCPPGTNMNPHPEYHSKCSVFNE